MIITIMRPEEIVFGAIRPHGASPTLRLEQDHPVRAAFFPGRRFVGVLAILYTDEDRERLSTPVGF